MSESQNKPRHTAKKILRILENHQVELQRLGVRKIGLFGSYRRGTPTPESDIDFLVKLEKPSFDAYMKTKFYLEDLFECNVDLVMEETLKPRLRPYVIQEVLYAEGL